jgi:hypothetical protein
VVADKMSAELLIVIEDWKKDFVIIGGFLDPEIKDHDILTQNEKERIFAVIRGHLREFERAPAIVSSTLPSPSTSNSQSADLRTRRLSQLRLQTVQFDQDEISKYLSMSPTLDVAVNDFWKQHSTVLPCLSRLAFDFLAVPVTAVQSERENSKARYVITQARNRLAGSTIQATMCCKSWHPIIQAIEQTETDANTVELE